MQQRTLSGAGLADNRQHLSLPHLEGQIFKDHQTVLAGPVLLLQVLDLKHNFSLDYWMHMPPLKEQCAARPKPQSAAVSARRPLALPTIIRPLSTRGSVVTEVSGSVTVQGIAARSAAFGTRHSALGHGLAAPIDHAERQRTFCRTAAFVQAPLNAECGVPSAASLISQCLRRQNPRC